jgi:signal peptidase I
MPEQDTPEISTVPSLEKELPKASLRAGVWNALSWVRDLAFSVLIAVVSIVFIYQPVKVEGTSMMPGLTDQERIFINKFTYRFGLGSIERGDTVVFEFPGDTSKSYIKRVIGLPGDRIRIDRGQVYVNDPGAGGRLRRARLPGRREQKRDRGGARRILRPGRPSEFLQRQPRLGHRPAQIYLWQSGVLLLAAEKMGRLR